MAWVEILDGPDAGKRFDLSQGELSIGRQALTCEIALSDETVSRVHARLTVRPDGQVMITDANSTNGTVVGGRRIQGQVTLSDGDIIALGNTRIRFNTDTSSPLVKNATGRGKAPYPYFQRSPRLKPEIPSGEVEVSNPPLGQSKPQISWLTILLPPIAMTVMSVAMATMTTGGYYVYFTLGMTLITVIVSLINYWSQLKAFKAREEQRRRAYLSYINGLRTEMEGKREQQRQAANEIHPPIEECVKRAGELDRRLWERTPQDEDFLSVRVGSGTEPFKVTLRISKQDFSLDEDPLKNEPAKLAEEFTNVTGAPVFVPLREAGAVGLVGDRNSITQLARALIIQTATHHSYDEVKIIGLFPVAEAADWEWMRWLPHTWDDNRQVRFLANEKDAAHRILSVIYEQIRARENALADHSRSVDIRIPHLLFIVADSKLAENEPVMRYLLDNTSHLGISTLFLVDRLDLLPKNCRAIIEAGPKSAQIYYRENAYNRVQFVPDYIDVHEADRFARFLAPVRLRQLGAVETFPERVDFLDVFRVSTVEQLNIKDRWSRCRPYRSLAVPLGKKAGGEDFIFDPHQFGHGPHGLVAGTVGSGKSEILQTLILALAVNFPPQYVSFVLIDYKGGAMANAFRGLPHLAGTITNLGGNETARALVSIKSEIIRRQRILDDYGLQSLEEYLRYYKEGKASEPLPHLFIIADEFAELKVEQPEFIDEVVRAARIGRTLGVHLILATQKPSGVVNEQIWSNSRFKLCLKVLEPADSREMIKRPDAASIQVPGRCYILVGYNELFEQFQSAWSGAEYKPYAVSTASKDVHIINLDGSRRKPFSDDQTSAFTPEKLTQLRAVVQHISEVARAMNLDPLPDLWLPPLPERISLEELRIDSTEGWDGETWRKASSWIKPVIGKVDDPANQIQEPLAVDLGREGHLVVYGSPGAGKSTFLQTLVTSLAFTYSPEDVNIYILDFGGRIMNVFSDLPHVGGVVFEEEGDKLQKLFRLLRKELEDRKRRFSEIGVNNLPAFRQGSGERVPAIVLAIDNYAALTELYGYAEDMIAFLSREGGNYGIHLVITANAPNVVRFKISQNIKLAMALHMTDKSDYISIVGRTNGLEPANIPGRGLVRSKPPLEFQTALPVQAGNEAEMAFAMKNLFKDMRQKWKGRKARAIPLLPDVLVIEELLKNDDVRLVLEKGNTIVPLGLDTEDMEPVCFDLLDTLCLLVSGQLNSGKTSILRTIVEISSRRLEPDDLAVYIMDSSDMNLAAMSSHSHVREYTAEAQRFNEIIAELIEELNLRKRDANAAKRKTASGFNEIEYIRSRYPVLLIVIDNLSEFIVNISDETKMSVERIVRFGKGLGICLAVSGLSDDLNKLVHIDSLTRAMADMQTGVVLGGAFEQHSVFSVNMPYQERSRPLYPGEGYFVQRGRYIRTKLAIHN